MTHEDSAQDYLAKLDAIPHEYDHECTWCGDGFDKGHGSEIEGDKFCKECMRYSKYIYHFENCGLSAADINELTIKSI